MSLWEVDTPPRAHRGCAPARNMSERMLTRAYRPTIQWDSDTSNKWFMVPMDVTLCDRLQNYIDSLISMLLISGVSCVKTHDLNLWPTDLNMTARVMHVKQSIPNLNLYVFHFRWHYEQRYVENVTLNFDLLNNVKLSSCDIISIKM